MHFSEAPDNFFVIGKGHCNFNYWFRSFRIQPLDLDILLPEQYWGSIRRERMRNPQEQGKHEPIQIKEGVADC